MKHAYAVKDSATDSFQIPFFTDSRGEAMRHFSDAARANPEQSAIAKHPEDYTLYEVGTYDPKTGALAPKLPEQVLRAKDCIITQEK